MSPDFSPEVFDELDDILEGTSCSLLIEDIGDLIFGGLLGRPRLDDYFDDLIEAGTAFRRHEGLPLAVPVPPDLGFFLIAWAVECLQEAMIGDGARGIDKVERRMDKIEQRHGGRDDIPPWRPEDAPPAWQAASREWDRLADEILVDALEPYADDMASLFRDDLAEFDRRRETGRQSLARLMGREDLLRPFEERLAEFMEAYED